MTQRKPLTIITVCYNEKNIEATCLSIVHQTWQNFEWIVVDGGSTDGTLDVLERYRDRIDVFISEKDSGIFDAMNKGIKSASGKYLNFMNGGDYFLDCFVLEKMFVVNSFDADIIYGDCFFQKKEGGSWMEEFPDVLPSDFFRTNALAHQASFIKKELFDKYGLYNAENRIVSDWAKFIEFIVVHQASYVHYRGLVAIQDCDGISSLPTEQHMNERDGVVKRLIHEHKDKFQSWDELNLCNEKEIPLGGECRTIYRVILLGFISLLKIRENKKRRYFMIYLFNFILVAKIKIR